MGDSGGAGPRVDRSSGPSHTAAEQAGEAGRLRAELHHLAYHDPLTGLPNRRLLSERIGEVLRRVPAHPTGTWLMFIDLDDFKDVNDATGHETGDAVLVEMAHRLRQVVEAGDVARVGGDEFAVLVTERSSRQAHHLARRVVDALRAPLQVQGNLLVCGGTVGLAAAQPGDDPSALVRRADLAMYEAKRAGHTVAEYQSRMLGEAQERLRLGATLRAVLEHERFELLYQPVVDLTSGQTVGLEALLRWRDDDGRLRPPGDLLGFAAAVGAVGRVTGWVLAAALESLRLWLPRWPDLWVAVNLSGPQLAQEETVPLIEQTLAARQVPGRAVVLEITEEVLARRLVQAAADLGPLRRLGLRISLDDFGEGHSSLSHLARIKPDMLKLDRAFVADLSASEYSDALLSGVLRLGTDLGAQVVAEGVETPQQADHLRALGCTYGQGFVLGRPVPASVVPASLSQSGCWLGLAGPGTGS